MSVADVVGSLTKGMVGGVTEPIPEAISSVSNFLNSILERVIPDPIEKEKAKAVLAEIKNTGELQEITAESGILQGQIEINKIEASSDSIWKSGARPFILWTCGGTFFLHYLLFPIANFVLATFGHSQVVVEFDVGTVMTVMLGLLGITFGGLRTAEKVKGVA